MAEIICVDQCMPLSLRHSCILCIVVNVNTYPVSLLSRFPISIRRLLLVYLPGIDIHRLERTEFVEGIDVGRIWEEIYEACKLHLPNPKKNQFVKSPCNSDDLDVTNGKEEILDCAVESVFKQGSKYPFEILLALRNVELVDADVSCVFMNYTVTPSNRILSKEYSKIFTNPPFQFGYFFPTECPKLLMSAFGKYPKIIPLSFITVQFGNATLDEPPHDFIEFLSGLEVLCLSGGIIPRDKDEVISCFKSILQTNAGRLKTLLVNTELCETQLRDISPLFSLGSSKTRPGYDGLEHFSAGKFMKQEMTHSASSENKNPFVDICSIISFQKGLRNVRLYGYFGYSSTSESLMSCLCKLAKQDQLKSLIVEGYSVNCKISVEKFSKLLIQFLFNGNANHLMFTHFQLVNSAVTSLKMAKLSRSVMSSSTLSPGHSMRLDITGVIFPESLVQLLGKIMRHRMKFCLQFLGLSIGGLATEYYMSLPGIFSSREFLLTFHNSVVDGSPLAIESSARQIAHFISMPVIEKLVLKCINLNSLTVCETISHTLSTQATLHQRLTNIHFYDCIPSTPMQTGCLELIFKGLLTLAQKVKLEVKFVNDSYVKFMTREQVDILNKVWKTMLSDNGHLTRLYKLESVLINAGEDELLKMEEVVENFCPVFKTSIM